MKTKMVIVAIIIFVIIIFLIFYMCSKNTESKILNQTVINEEQNRFKIVTVIEKKENDKFDLNGHQRIPKIIHQTYSKDKMDIEYYETCMINKYMNLEYDYRFYTDKQAEDYIQLNFPQYITAYRMLIPGAYKADLFRYLVLYKEGGVYMDCKASTILPLRHFIPSDIGFVSFRDESLTTIQISFIASIPKHPLLKRCIDLAVDNILHKRYGKNNLDITGPQVCGRALNQLLFRGDLEKIDEKRYDEVDVEILGTQKFTGKNRYQVLYDRNNTPLVARTCGSYNKKSLLSFFENPTYGQQWTMGNVFNDVTSLQPK